MTDPRERERQLQDEAAAVLAGVAAAARRPLQVVLPPRLTPETRLAILEIKEACLGRPWSSSYGT